MLDGRGRCHEPVCLSLGGKDVQKTTHAPSVHRSFAGIPGSSKAPCGGMCVCRFLFGGRVAVQVRVAPNPLLVCGCLIDKFVKWSIRRSGSELCPTRILRNYGNQSGV